MRNWLKTEANFIRKKMRLDDGRDGAGELTLHVSRFRVWKKTFTCSQPFQGAGPGVMVGGRGRGEGRGETDTQISAWCNPGAHSDSAIFKPCSS